MRMHKVIFTGVVGSKLHRTDGPTSDTDTRVVYRRSLTEQLSPFRTNTDVHEGIEQYSNTTYFELSHFARMLCKGNPTTVEIVHALHRGGDRYLLEELLRAAMDTEKYVSQCNGMIQGMLKRATPKRLHHAARVHTHLTNYVERGIIDFNAARYHNYGYLLALKRGEAEFDPKYAEKVHVRRVWDVADREAVDNLVLEQYMEDVL